MARAKEAVLLPLPGKFDIEDYKVSKVPCGFLAVELARIKSQYHAQEKLSGMKCFVADYIPPGIMFLHQMCHSLCEEGIKVRKYDGRQSDLQQIFCALDRGRPVIAFLGCGVGHWVTLWGYDEEKFFMFDNRSGVTRDENGLSTMTHREFSDLWKKIPLILKPCEWFGRYFPKIKVAPMTMVVPR